MTRAMRRDPLSIVSILIQTLESLKENRDYTFNELSNRTNLHWETVKKYMFLIKYIQNLAPLIEIEGNKFRIIKKPSSKTLNLREKLLATLFYSRAFQENSAIQLQVKDNSIVQDLLTQELIQTTEHNTFYLTDSGKRIAFRIYRKITDTIYEEYLKLYNNLPLETTAPIEDLQKKIENLTERIKHLELLIKK